MSVEIIQIIEDDPTHAALLDHALRKARYRTNITHEGLRGLDETKRLKPSLVLIDVMLPGLDGHELCRRLRHDPQTRMIPIMIVTALGSQDDRIRAYELGVDDYVTKPFSTREVVLRVKAVLRRGQLGHVRERYLDGELVLEDSFYVVAFRGRRFALSGPEWWILRRLARNTGEVVTTEELTALFWGDDGLVYTHELDRLIQALKWNLAGDAYDQEMIISMPGIGYGLRLSR
jgi:DNA-binding response OmpR family regulator